MNILEQSHSLPELTKAWAAVQGQMALRPIRTDEDFKRMRAMADTLADSVGDDESHPLYSLFEIAIGLIERWEDEHVSIPQAAPSEILRHLLEVNNLKQKDLEDIASNSLVSDILAGRRAISKRLAKALALRFRVDIAAFI